MHHLPQPKSWTRRELGTCILCNRINRFRLLSASFAAASYLGNGLLWYALMLLLLISDGMTAVPVVLSMGVAGIIATLLYKILKASTMRPRPCAVSRSLCRTVDPLDRFSFPSGHTLHAVCFTMIAIAHYPALAVYLLPFTLMVAASRLVLGLHYPSDVIAGAGIGAATATITLAIVPPIPAL